MIDIDCLFLSCQAICDGHKQLNKATAKLYRYNDSQGSVELFHICIRPLSIKK